MDFFDLVTISERTMELVNPSTPAKVLKLGRALRLQEGSRVIDFGCGYAEALVLWAKAYGISGIGIDIRQAACDRAREKVMARGLADRIEIVCGKGDEYRFEPAAFDAATCIGATFIWGGFQPSIRAMKRAIRKGGRLGVGEPYWRHANVPQEVRELDPEILFEADVLRAAREEGFDLEIIVRANLDDWDRYESDNWHGLIHWLEENPNHPEREQVYNFLRRQQDEYFAYGREHLGWAMMALAPGQGAT